MSSSWLPGIALMALLMSRRQGNYQKLATPQYHHTDHEARFLLCVCFALFLRNKNLSQPIFQTFSYLSYQLILLMFYIHRKTCVVPAKCESLTV